MEKKKRVKCLYRVSTLKQVEGDDIPMQRGASRNFAALHPDWVITEEKVEKGISGFKTSANDRDAVMDLLDDARANGFDVLLVYMMDRLGRIADETSLVSRAFHVAGVEVWSVTEGQQHYDTHADVLMNFLRFWTAEGESRKTSIRTRTRLEQIVKEGRFRGGITPYGYRLEKQGRINARGNEVNEILMDETEAPVVARMFELSGIYGYGSRRIATTLTEAGIYNRNGRPFHPASIQNMLKNILYTGVLRSGESRSEVFPHLQIVSESLFARVQEQIASHRSDYEASRLSPVLHTGRTLLSGNIFCGTRGARLNATSVRATHHAKAGENPRVPMYRCYNRMRHKDLCDGQSTYRAEKVDAVVEQAVLNVLDHIQVMDGKDYLIKRRQKELNAVQSQLHKLEKSFNDAVEKRKKLGGYIVSSLDGSGPFSAEDLKEQMDILKEEIGLLGRQMENQRSLLVQTRRQEEAISQQFQELKGYAQVYRDTDFDEKRRIVSALVEKVMASRGYKIQIMFRVGVDLLEGFAEDMGNITEEAS